MKGRLTLLGWNPSIGEKKFFVLELKVIKDRLDIRLTLENDVLSLLNVSTESTNGRSTEDIIDKNERSTRSKGVGFSVTKELEDVTNSKDRFNNVLAVKVSETQRNKTVNNLLSEVLGRLQHALSHNHENNGTSTSGIFGKLGNLRKNESLEIAIESVHQILKGPREILKINGIVDVTNHQVDRINYFVEFHRVPIAKNVSADFNDGRSSRRIGTIVTSRRRTINVKVRVATVGARFGKKVMKFHLIGLHVGLTWRSDNFTEERERRRHTVRLEMRFDRKKNRFPLRGKVKEVVGVLQVCGIIGSNL